MALFSAGKRNDKAGGMMTATSKLRRGNGMARWRINRQSMAWQRNRSVISIALTPLFTRVTARLTHVAMVATLCVGMTPPRGAP